MLKTIKCATIETKECGTVYKENFPIRIKKARKDAGYTQLQVAESTGIPKSSISKYETGNLEPDLEKLAQLAKFYNVSINWLLGVDIVDERNSTKKEAG